MGDAQGKIDTLAELMREYRLSAAEWSEGGLRIALRKSVQTAPVAEGPSLEAEHWDDEEEAVPAPAPAAVGFPVNSPMTGIYYGTPNASSPPFVKEGTTVNAGDVIALIEAMKVFNEVTAPMSGTVLKVHVGNGAIVNQGDTLLTIG